ncbi:hypothetical protein [Pseudoflavonifractor sp. An85]|uniref:hypothetical protein n=1 Tax=Pseudoflavonifractor sp. An85 TaxID=1965661 RepID=UPI000B37A901|nr:hypothetical protein [Pseudoflavonifractor sp. An85]OUN24565.1 hypothetical protein B5G37_07185 [Pseudoflavonifractor sp. An85]
MLIQEFTDMTGFEPTPEEFQEIESEYYRFDGDKQAFCKDFVERSGEKQVYARRAEYIKELYSRLMDQEKEYTAKLNKLEEAYAEQILKLTARVAQLQEELDREMEWRPADNVGTHMSQEEYEDLAKHGHKLGLEDTIKLIATEFGFAPGRLEIKDEAATYEVNKYRKFRVKDELERPPVYSSTDWNYIRFDCAGIQYEMINGELVRYED